MYRSSLFGGIGYCALDRRRAPLSGSEQRACWTATAAAGAEGFFSAPVAPPAERGLTEVKTGPAAGPISGR
jgi:hypothetical protein